MYSRNKVKIRHKEPKNRSERKRRFLYFDSSVEVLKTGYSVKTVFWNSTTKELSSVVSLGTSLEQALINNVKKYYSEIKGEIK